MSSSFIGSKIAIVTKSQCRYVGTIIGIDAKASSIVLGNVKCFGTENRGGNFSNGQIVGTIQPIMQFANSDIEDLKIVDDEQNVEQTSYPTKVLSSPPAPPPVPPSSIHDDPAIVSAVVSTTNKDLSMSSRLIHDLHHLNLSDDQSKKSTKTDESRIRNDSGELGPSWSLISPPTWENNKSTSQQQSGNKSKFFDDFSLNNSEQFQANRSQQRWTSNTHSTQTLRNQDIHSNKEQNDNDLPVRQPFFSNDHPYPQQQNRYQNGNVQQQRYFYNNRRPKAMNQQRRPGGSNRETFQDNGNNYDDDFDFETSNRKFNKIISEDEFKQQTEPTNQFFQPKIDNDSKTDYEPIYDKKKSFFDNITLEEATEFPTPLYNRSRNQDTFGNERNSRQKNRGGATGGYRRPNNNYRQQSGNEDFYYRQNNNGYHYRY